MALSTSDSEIECKCWKPAGNGHNTPHPVSAVRASDILCSRHFQMANLQMLVISKINWISVLLWEWGLGGLWHPRVQLAYHAVVRLWHKQVLALFTSRMTSRTCKIHTLSWLPASRSELNYLWLLTRQQGSSSNSVLFVQIWPYIEWQGADLLDHWYLRQVGGGCCAWCLLCSLRGSAAGKYIHVLCQSCLWESNSRSNRETLISHSLYLHLRSYIQFYICLLLARAILMHLTLP